MGISNIDKNFRMSDEISDYVEWHKADKLYGIIHGNYSFPLARLGEEILSNGFEHLRVLSNCTSGVRARFKTNSICVAIRAKLYNKDIMPIMPMSGAAGFDMYIKKDGKFTFVKGFVPNYTDNAFQREYTFNGREDKEININFPLYCGIEEVEIGIEKGSYIEFGIPYKNEKPVVFYGSSITQGGCASRPGNCYVNMVSNLIDTDICNLGLSGNCRGEKKLAEYISKFDMSAFVLDYDHNAPSVEHYRNTHYPFYKTIRDTHKNIPIIIATRPNRLFDFENMEEREEIARSTYLKAKANGDTNVYFISGAEFFTDSLADSCTVDGVHPGDLGFYKMAEKISKVLEKVLY